MIEVEPIAVLREVSKHYASSEQKVLALKSIDLTIRAGDYLAITGPSGSGKSTLLSVLGCLDSPSGGSYRLFDQDVIKLSRTELADLRGEYIGFVFQSFNLLPRLTAYQNVELPLLYRGVPAGERKERVSQALASMGLGHRESHLPVELSGGEQQRVAIARALVGTPPLLIADEPTGNLDQARGDEVMEIFETLHRAGQTIVVVTHDAKVAQRARRQVEIRDGTILRDFASEVSVTS